MRCPFIVEMVRIIMSFVSVVICFVIVRPLAASFICYLIVKLPDVVFDICIRRLHVNIEVM